MIKNIILVFKKILQIKTGFSKLLKDECIHHHREIARQENGKGNLIMIENIPELQPINQLCRASYISEIGKDNFLVKWTKQDVGSEFFRRFRNHLFDLILRKTK